MKLRNIIVLLSVQFLIAGCDPADNRLVIVNNSDHNIYYYISCDSILDNDLKIIMNSPGVNLKGDSIQLISHLFVRSNSTNNAIQRGFNAWPHYIRNCKNKTIYLFVFNESEALKYSDTYITNVTQYDSCLVYNLKEVRKSNWTLVFE